MMRDALTRWVPLGLTLFTCAALWGAQDEHFRQRQELDPGADQWATVEPDPVTEPLAEARRLLAFSEGRKARKILDEWIEDYPDHELLLNARFLLGEAYFVEGDYWKAAEQYEIVADAAAGELFYSALRRTMDVARAFLGGEKRIVWGFIRLPARDEGVELLDRVWERVPGTRIGEQAIKLKADHFFERGEMDLAQDEYALLVREYPEGRYARQAMLRGAEAAEASFPSIDHDDKPLIEAADRYKDLKAAFPTFAETEAVDVRLTAIRETRAAKDLQTGQWYERTGRTAAAAFYYRTLVRDWPETPAAAEAARRVRDLGYDADVESMEDSES